MAIIKPLIKDSLKITLSIKTIRKLDYYVEFSNTSRTQVILGALNHLFKAEGKDFENFCKEKEGKKNSNDLSEYSDHDDSSATWPQNSLKDVRRGYTKIK